VLDSASRPTTGPSQSSTRSPGVWKHLIGFPPRSEASSVRAIGVLIVGFTAEGATEAFQFLERGHLAQGPLVYYLTLATTILGFYLMFLGLREWQASRPRRRRRIRIPWLLIQLLANASLSISLWLGRHFRRFRRKHFWPWTLSVLASTGAVVVATERVSRPPKAAPSRRIPWTGLALWSGGTAATALLSIGLGPAGVGPTPDWIAWPVGGVVVLAFGNFFLGLRKLAAPLGSTLGAAAGWAAFVWSLGVASVAGLVIGNRALQLVVEFFTNWSALIASIAPIVVAMSPLFVTYGLLVAAFGTVVRQLQVESSTYPRRARVAE
jgi:hypothetical protein